MCWRATSLPPGDDVYIPKRTPSKDLPDAGAGRYRNQSLLRWLLPGVPSRLVHRKKRPRPPRASACRENLVAKQIAVGRPGLGIGRSLVSPELPDFRQTLGRKDRSSHRASPDEACTAAARRWDSKFAPVMNEFREHLQLFFVA